MSMVWARATEKHPSKDLCPSQYGWRREGATWKFVWFSGSAIPSTVMESLEDEEDDRVDDEEDGAWSENEDMDEE